MQVDALTKSLLAATLLLSVAGCWKILGGSISSGDLEATAICGPLPTPVVGERKQRLRELTIWLELEVVTKRPEDTELFRELILEDPFLRRRQIRTCHDTINGDG